LHSGKESADIKYTQEISGEIRISNVDNVWATGILGKIYVFYI